MTYYLQFAGESLIHISKRDNTLCGINEISGDQYILKNDDPPDGIICRECEAVKREEAYELDLEEDILITTAKEALKRFGNFYILFRDASELARLVVGLNEALDYSNTSLLDALEYQKTVFEISTQESIEVSYEKDEEQVHYKVKISKLNFFEKKIRNFAFESHFGRRN